MTIVSSFLFSTINESTRYKGTSSTLYDGANDVFIRPNRRTFTRLPPSSVPPPFRVQYATHRIITITTRRQHVHRTRRLRHGPTNTPKSGTSNIRLRASKRFRRLFRLLTITLTRTRTFQIRRRRLVILVRQRHHSDLRLLIYPLNRQRLRRRYTNTLSTRPLRVIFFRIPRVHRLNNKPSTQRTTITFRSAIRYFRHFTPPSAMHNHIILVHMVV